MGVLVTRPAATGQDLAVMLAQRGITAIHQPLIEIRAGEQLSALPQKLAQLTTGDNVICVSQYAVEYAQQVMQNVKNTWRDDLRYLAIGRRTAQKLVEATEQPVLYPFAQENSEGALTLLVRQQNVGQRALILRGQQGRNLLLEQLSRMGMCVETVACYYREKLKWSEETVSRILQAGIDTIVVTSGEILGYLLDFIPKSEHNWLFKCRLVVISRRLEQIAMMAGWQQDRIILSEKADNQSILATIVPLYSDVLDR